MLIGMDEGICTIQACHGSSGGSAPQRFPCTRWFQWRLSRPNQAFHNHQWTMGQSQVITEILTWKRATHAKARERVCQVSRPASIGMEKCDIHSCKRSLGEPTSHPCRGTDVQQTSASTTCDHLCHVLQAKPKPRWSLHQTLCQNQGHVGES